jgi:hypothetical protein
MHKYRHVIINGVFGIPRGVGQLFWPAKIWMGFYLTISVTLTKTNMQNNLNRGILL